MKHIDEENLAPLSPEMHRVLTARLAALDLDREGDRVKLIGPDLRCATVEDAERLAARFATWLGIFTELRDICTLDEDRAAFARLYATFDQLVADLETAIRATRDQGVPWVETRNLAAPRSGIVAAQKIYGAGTIGPEITVVTTKDQSTEGDPQ